jgi:hypothetical protein
MERKPSDTLQALANGWLEYQRAREVGTEPPRDELFSFVVGVDELVRYHPDAAWLVIQLIFCETRNDVERACLAAGPLEDLLAKHGDAFIDRIEKAAQESGSFRELLVGVWRSVIPQPIWERLQRAAGTD